MFRQGKLNGHGGKYPKSNYMDIIQQVYTNRQVMQLDMFIQLDCLYNSSVYTTVAYAD